MNESSKVSIVMPAYNAGETIVRAIKSVKNQSYKNWVLYVIDDCSTDNTYSQIAGLLDDSRIKYFRNDKNYGASITRNKGLDLSEEDIITFLDSDDVWDIDKLKKQMSCFENGSEFILTNYNFITSKKTTKVEYKEKEVDEKSFLMKKYRVCFSSVLYRKSKRTENIRFKNVGHEDFLFLYELFRCFRTAKICTFPLVNYYVGENSLSSNKNKAVVWQWDLLKIIFKRNYPKVIFYFVSYAYRGWLFNKGRF